MADLMVHSL